jgi:hydroxypyruvate isomerase
LNWDAHVGLLYAELPLAERFEAAAADGFAYAEMWSPPGEAGEIAAAVRASGVELVGFNLEAGDLAAGERGFLNDERRHDEVMRWVEQAARFADATGARQINALVGNRIGSDPERELEVAAGFLERMSAAVDITLLVEASNAHDTPDYLLNDVDRAAGFVRALRNPRIRLLFDAYHVSRSGSDPVAAVARVQDVLGHVHVADAPGRGAPGTGSLDLPGLIRALGDVGYGGFVGLEYRAGPSTTESLAWLGRDRRSADCSAWLDWE